MSKADEIFIANCKNILENGYSSENEKYDLIGKMEHLLTQ